MKKDSEADGTNGELSMEASHLIDQGYYEDAISKLNQCFSLEEDPGGMADLLSDLGFCFLGMGWHEDAVKIFSQYLKFSPFDNDIRFYLRVNLFSFYCFKREWRYMSFLSFASSRKPSGHCG